MLPNDWIIGLVAHMLIANLLTGAYAWTQEMKISKGLAIISVLSNGGAVIAGVIAHYLGA